MGISARDKGKDRGVDTSGIKWFDDPVALAKDPGIDVFVELIGGSDGVAKDAVEAALRAGKHVVTANKALVAKHGVKLAKLAEEKGVALNFEAAVAGGIPVIKTLREVAGRQRGDARLRHPQRHLQLHPVDHDRPASLVRRGAGGSAGLSAMPKPIRPTTSAASTPRTSSPF